MSSANYRDETPLDLSHASEEDVRGALQAVLDHLKIDVFVERWPDGGTEYAVEPKKTAGRS